jgi:hypothetical protein
MKDEMIVKGGEGRKSKSENRKAGEKDGPVKGQLRAVPKTPVWASVQLAARTESCSCVNGVMGQWCFVLKMGSQPSFILVTFVSSWVLPSHDRSSIS